MESKGELCLQRNCGYGHTELTGRKHARSCVFHRVALTKEFVDLDQREELI